MYAFWYKIYVILYVYIYTITEWRKQWQNGAHYQVYTSMEQSCFIFVYSLFLMKTFHIMIIVYIIIIGIHICNNNNVMI